MASAIRCAARWRRRCSARPASCWGALSLSGPLERFSEVASQRMNSLLFTAAENATRTLGGQWPAPATQLAG